MAGGSFLMTITLTGNRCSAMAPLWIRFPRSSFRLFLSGGVCIAPIAGSDLRMPRQRWALRTSATLQAGVDALLAVLLDRFIQTRNDHEATASRDIGAE